MLEQYEPQKFFHWFENITRIPRPSFHEEKIADFLEAFALERGFICYRDGMNNVLMRVPASQGYEDQPPLLLQSHTDMIAQMDDGIVFDFLKDPIQLEIRGNELHAQGTTLGADDAGGMSIMLAIADSPELQHPELELLFTTQEEVGMHGIKSFDLSLIRSRRMINLDCGRMHNISVSSAGATTAVVDETFSVQPVEGTLFNLSIFGGIGGHSGLDIHKNRACAANVLGELLHEAGKAHPLHLVAVDTPRQPILSEIKASFVVESSQATGIARMIREAFAEVKKRYLLTDPDLSLELAAQDPATHRVISSQDSMRMAMLMYLMRSGTRKHDGENPQIILTSGVVSSVKLKDEHFRFVYVVRAVEDHEAALHSEVVRETARLLDFSMSLTKNYPGWPKSPQSRMVDLFDKVHQRLFGYVPGHQYIHGGIEVGIILGAIPEMDAIGLLPSMANAHTTRELLYIDQVPDYWKLMTALLAEKV